MTIKRKNLKSLRTKAFNSQYGRCYYCQNPMWNEKPSELSSKYKISPKNCMKFQCTGEHLIPHCEGGSANQSNIVAACWYCNSKRHRRKNPPNDKNYQKFVQKRVNLGKWNCNLISSLQ